jgi:hypothetical protein
LHELNGNPQFTTLLLGKVVYEREDASAVAGSCCIHLTTVHLILKDNKIDINNKCLPTTSDRVKNRLKRWRNTLCCGSGGSVFLGRLVPDPVVRGTDPDPGGPKHRDEKEITKKKSF